MPPKNTGQASAAALSHTVTTAVSGGAPSRLNSSQLLLRHARVSMPAFASASIANGLIRPLGALPEWNLSDLYASIEDPKVQADLAKVGINAKLVSYEWGEYRKRMQAGEHQMGLLGWTGDNGDPDNFLAVLLGCDKDGKPNGNNIPKWCDAKFQEDITKAVQITDIAERTKLYQDAQKIVAAQVPWVNIAHSTVFEPVRKSVTGYKISPFGSHEFQNVDVAE